jgi:hypothetical protein
MLYIMLSSGYKCGLFYINLFQLEPNMILRFLALEGLVVIADGHCMDVEICGIVIDAV